MQRRIVLHVMLVVVTALLAVTAPASAHVSWCSSDPVIVLPDETVLNVIVEAPIEYIGSHVVVNMLGQRGSEMTEVINGDLILDPSFADVLPNPRFFVTARPVGTFPLRVTVLRDNLVVQVIEGRPGTPVNMWLQF